MSLTYRKKDIKCKKCGNFISCRKLAYDNYKCKCYKCDAIAFCNLNQLRFSKQIEMRLFNTDKKD